MLLNKEQANALIMAAQMMADNLSALSMCAYENKKTLDSIDRRLATLADALSGLYEAYAVVYPEAIASQQEE